MPCTSPSTQPERTFWSALQMVRASSVGLRASIVLVSANMGETLRVPPDGDPERHRLGGSFGRRPYAARGRDDGDELSSRSNSSYRSIAIRTARGSLRR